VKWLGEKRTLYTGQFFGALGMIIAGVARTGAVYIASIPVISMWNISFPAAQGMMTHRVSEREQGELQGAIQSLRSIAFVIGPFLFSGIFAWFIDPKHSFHVPGAPYYLAAALLFAAMLLAFRVEQPEFREGEAVETEQAVPAGGVASVAPLAEPSEENI
jgi:DHA1 family tetracycline resistance protein-like MFS transporter